MWVVNKTADIEIVYVETDSKNVCRDYDLKGTVIGNNGRDNKIRQKPN